MTILEGTIQGKYIVQDIQIQETIKRRLEALGIIPGTRMMLMNRKKNGTSIIKVRGTRWAIGRRIAGGILVEEEQEEISASCAATTSTGGILVEEEQERQEETAGGGQL